MLVVGIVAAALVGAPSMKEMPIPCPVASDATRSGDIVERKANAKKRELTPKEQHARDILNAAEEETNAAPARCRRSCTCALPGCGWIALKNTRTRRCKRCWCARLKARRM
jgi:hypothetical protein